MNDSNNRLLKIRGENPFEQILQQPRTPGLLSMVRMGCVPPIERTFVFTSPKKGIHIVHRRETLRVFGKGLTVTKKRLHTIYLQPNDFLVKDSAQIRRETLDGLRSLYRGEWKPYVAQVYPRLEALLKRSDVPHPIGILSVHKLCKHRLFTVKACYRFLYPNLSRRLIGHLEHSDAFAQQQARHGLSLRLLNEWAGKHRGVEGWAMRVFAPGTLGGCLEELLILSKQTLRMSQACGARFSFAWSERRMRDEYGRLARRLTESALALDPRTVEAHPVFRHDWSRFNTDRTRIRAFDNGAILSLSTLLLESVSHSPSWAEEVEKGRTAVLLVRHEGLSYHAHVAVAWGLPGSNEPGMVGVPEPLRLRLLSCYGYNHSSPPVGLQLHLEDMLRVLSLETDFSTLPLAPDPRAESLLPEHDPF
jgi:hypothetical protein